MKETPPSSEKSRTAVPLENVGVTVPELPKVMFPKGVNTRDPQTGGATTITVNVLVVVVPAAFTTASV